MRRREFVVRVGGAALAWPLSSRGQSSKIYRIGFLSSSVQEPAYEGLRKALPELGYIEGQNVTLDARFADGHNDRLPGLVTELIERKPDVIVAVATNAALAAKKATNTIPIVFTLVSDPISTGLVSSLAKPGANLTGTSELQAQLTGKRYEILKETVPSLKSVVFLFNPVSPVTATHLKESQIAARRLGLEHGAFEVQDLAELESTFAKFAGKTGQGIELMPDPLLYSFRTQIADLAIKHRTPLMGWQFELANSGALLSYGSNHFESGRFAATYVAKILRGANPASLPVAQSATFELVINMRTAKALGLRVPPAIVARADRLIE